MRNATQDASSFWGYLINQDKTAARPLKQLCLGLSRVIGNLGPGPENEITPTRLAAFYRSVGGDLDSLLTKPSYNGLSFMYRTLGCFHSLQPTDNAFETPCVPCLTPDGFVTWQTLYILICPEEHAKYMQRAVQEYSVPNPDGGTFPKHIPRTAFPSRPDEEIEEWRAFVASGINQESYTQRRKQSPPHQSPPREQPTSTGTGGYVGNTLYAKRSVHPSSRASYNEQARLEDLRRRTSIGDPHVPPPDMSGHYHVEGDRLNKSRSHSAQRQTNSSRPRSSTASTAAAQYRSPPPSAPRHFSTSVHGQASSTSVDRMLRPPQTHQRNERYRSSPSSVESAEDASSEESSDSRRRRPKEEQTGFKALLPPFLRSSKQRRHSSDAALRKNDDRSPRRTASRDDSRRRAQDRERDRLQHELAVRPPQRSVQFRNDLFREPDFSNNNPNSSAPETPTSAKSPKMGHRFSDTAFARYSDPHFDQHQHGPTSNSNTSWGNKGRGRDYNSGGYSAPEGPMASSQKRKEGPPMRVATVSTVNGPRYASVETRSRRDKESERGVRPRGAFDDSMV